MSESPKATDIIALSCVFIKSALSVDEDAYIYTNTCRYFKYDIVSSSQAILKQFIINV